VRGKLREQFCVGDGAAAIGVTGRSKPTGGCLPVPFRRLPVPPRCLALPFCSIAFPLGLPFPFCRQLFPSRRLPLRGTGSGAVRRSLMLSGPAPCCLLLWAAVDLLPGIPCPRFRCYPRHEITPRPGIRPRTASSMPARRWA